MFSVAVSQLPASKTEIVIFVEVTDCFSVSFFLPQNCFATLLIIVRVSLHAAFLLHHDCYVEGDLFRYGCKSGNPYFTHMRRL